MFRTGAFRCGCLQAARSLISQSVALGLGRVWPVAPPALGLSCTGLFCLQLWAYVACGRWVCRCGPESGRPHVCCFGTESRGRLVHHLRPVSGAASLCSRCTPTQGFRCGRPAGVSVLGPQSANLGVRHQASGEHRGCLSRVHSPGAEEGGAPEATAAGESSLTCR